MTLKFVSNRTNNFRKRLSIEREVLNVVNSVPNSPELLGLTRPAIVAWGQLAENHAVLFDVNRVVDLLIMIARHFGTITDNSRAIVSEEIVPNSDDPLLKALRLHLALT